MNILLGIIHIVLIFTVIGGLLMNYAIGVGKQHNMELPSALWDDEAFVNIPVTIRPVIVYISILIMMFILGVVSPYLILQVLLKR